MVRSKERGVFVICMFCVLSLLLVLVFRSGNVISSSPFTPLIAVLISVISGLSRIVMNLLAELKKEL